MTAWTSLRKPLGLLAAVLFTAALCTGCDYNDIDHLLFSSGIGVDRLQDHLRLSVDLVQPGGAGNPAMGSNSGSGGPNQALDEIVSADASTFEEAMSAIQSKLSHALYLQHNAVVLFSQDALRHFTSIADALERHRQLRRSQLWVVTPRSAEQIFRQSPGRVEPVSLVLRDLVDEASRREMCLASDELHVVKSLLRPSGVASLAVIDQGQDGSPELRGLAYLRRDGKVYIVDNDRLLNHAWWLGRTLDVREAVPWKVTQGEATVGLHWLRTSTRVIAQGSSASPSIRVVWRGTAEIERWAGGRTMSAAAFHALETAARRDIERRLQDALNEVRTADMDAFGLTNACVQKGLHVSEEAWKRVPVVYDVEPHIVQGQLAASTPFSSDTSGRG
ncbi:Ger(x)C family spore germination protein [Alicyclobacillus vulcanalis]|uniref:Spore germination B3/ GerAC like, C-terminal n=1 Tax=Alicyclobacillus vulcanalis TaxID=252246 RepID=A0A1N7NIR4_9BACL|nr:Ger(x)C family spore germination C-terminal domain-containing protein [Alicyclobacillus vulcanalis]SIS98138.1 Spore germination B3/ GerAC like, C-terminal [Alicyclobacillus vulcanalis]